MDYTAQNFKNKKYIVYGSNRVAKDFAYIFSDIINIVGYISADEEPSRECEYPIILCDFFKDEKITRLEKLGFKRGEDFYLESDLFHIFDSFHVTDDKELYVWGTGRNAEQLQLKEPQINVSGYIDSYKDIKTYNDKPVIKPDQLPSKEQCFVIISVYNCADIVDELNKKGFVEFEDYVELNDYLERPSKLLSETIFDRSYYELDCKTMLNHLEVLDHGVTSCCCTTFVAERLGNVLENTRNEVWNSVKHKILCLSTQNHTYSFCDKKMCPLFISNKKSDISSVDKNWIDADYCEMEKAPTTLAFGFDGGCNLHCVSCRNKPFVLQGEDKNEAEKISEIVCKDYLPNAKFVILAGNGEAFLCPTYRKIMTDPAFKSLKYVRILSNGMLFSEKNWEMLREHTDAKIMLTVSIDAASKDTYERIRRGGNFDILLKNLRFASDLKNKGELAYFRINFVVQSENYKEMPLFVKLGEELGVNEVFFTKILNWGTYTDDEFKEISMMEEDGETPKKKLQEVLETNEMKSSIVDMGTIQFSHKADEASSVFNYYMWELEKRGGGLF